MNAAELTLTICAALVVITAVANALAAHYVRTAINAHKERVRKWEQAQRELTQTLNDLARKNKR